MDQVQWGGGAAKQSSRSSLYSLAGRGQPHAHITTVTQPIHPKCNTKQRTQPSWGKGAPRQKSIQVFRSPPVAALIISSPPVAAPTQKPTKAAHGSLLQPTGRCCSPRVAAKIISSASPPSPAFPKLSEGFRRILEVGFRLPGVLPRPIAFPVDEELLPASDPPDSQNALHLVLLPTILQLHGLFSLWAAHHCLELGHMENRMYPPALGQLQSVGSLPYPLHHSKRASPSRCKLPGACLHW